MEATQRPAGHEESDVSIRPIVLTGGAVALMAFTVGLLVYGMFQLLSSERPKLIVNPMADNAPPPAPRITDKPTVELRDLRAQEDQILTTYGWADKKAGKVRIPIDRAIDLQLERGYPTRKEAPPK